MKKKKEKVIKNLYIGDIYECVSLVRTENSLVMHTTIKEANQEIAETTDGSYMRFSDYISGENRELLLSPEYERDLFINKSYLKKINL